MQSEVSDVQGGAVWHYVFSVIPALIGWMALALDTSYALVILAVAFSALLFVDVTWTSGRKAPEWYGRMRLQLTSAVLICLGLAWTAT